MNWLRRKIRLFAFDLLRRTELPKLPPPEVAPEPPSRFEDVSGAAQSWLAVHEITDQCMQRLIHSLISETEVMRLREEMTSLVASDKRCVWAGQRFIDHCRLGLWMQAHQLNAVWYPKSDFGHRWLSIGASQDVRRKQEVLRS